MYDYEIDDKKKWKFFCLFNFFKWEFSHRSVKRNDKIIGRERCFPVVLIIHLRKVNISSCIFLQFLMTLSTLLKIPTYTFWLRNFLLFFISMFGNRINRNYKTQVKYILPLFTLFFLCSAFSPLFPWNASIGVL